MICRATTPIANWIAPTSTRLGHMKSSSGCTYATSRFGPIPSASANVVATRNPSGTASTSTALVASAARKRPPRYSALRSRVV